MKTTPPRTLVQYMNTHIARWKNKIDEVQKVIDALPESHDHTSEIPAGDKKSLTISDNQSQNDEEFKGEKNPWDDQETMNMNDHTMIIEKKDASGSKAGATATPSEPEPQETTQSAMITSTP